MGGPSVREILDGIKIGVALLDRAGKILFVNRAAEEILEVSGPFLEGRQLFNLLMEEDDFSEVGREEGLYFYAVGENKKALKLMLAPYHDAEGRERGTIASLQDMTRLYMMQKEMLKKDRMAYLGEFSSTLAHEIRNPLAGIKTTAQALNEELSKGDPRTEYLERIIKEIDRLNDLLRTFFSFAKPRNLNLASYDMQQLIKEVRALLGREAQNLGITIKEKYARGLAPVAMDVIQMKQVLMNLFVNAFQAMPTGGELKIEVNGTNSSGQGIQVKIQDNGEGIAIDHVGKIFDPFFTTKSKGLGLGLAITQKIVEAHGGRIVVESLQGKGSTFILDIPTEPNDGSDGVHTDR